MATKRQPLLRSRTDERHVEDEVRAHEVTHSAQDHPDYPVLGGFIVFANSWGLPNAFGVFQTHYVETLLPDQDAVSIAWIGSIQLFFTTIGCLPMLEVLGLILTSYFQNYWAIFLSQGVCMGIGSGLLALLPVAILAMFFEKKHMLATGLASTGASIAGIAYTLSMRSLFLSVGFGCVARILTLAILATNGVAFATMRFQLQFGSKGSKFGFHHFRDLPYTVFVVAFALFVASSFVPFFFIQEYALQLGVPKDMAFKLLSIMNAANIFGRFVPNYIVDRYGGVNTLIPLGIACIVTLCLLPMAQTLNSLIAIIVAYGFLSDGMGVRLGLAYLVASFGGLMGNPLIRQIKGDGKDVTQNFNGVWFCAAAVMGAGVIALVATRWLKLGSPLTIGRV
ncbi:major facilitator superfamily domain-containing protein [Phaeosphaeriaceae sp. PMI808]|nr:major facilitator superfamily domain-containing protein [Phaeosphaeriaceae sp. PMI808]